MQDQRWQSAKPFAPSPQSEATLRQLLSIPSKCGNGRGVTREIPVRSSVVPGSVFLGLAAPVGVGPLLHQGALRLQGVHPEAHAQVGHIGLVDVIAVGAQLPVVLVHPVHLHLRRAGAGSQGENFEKSVVVLDWVCFAAPRVYLKVCLLFVGDRGG